MVFLVSGGLSEGARPFPLKILDTKISVNSTSGECIICIAIHNVPARINELILNKNIRHSLCLCQQQRAIVSVTIEKVASYEAYKYVLWMVTPALLHCHTTLTKYVYRQEILINMYKSTGSFY